MIAAGPNMRILKARYRSGKDFLDAYQSSFPNGGLFFPTREHVTVAEAVMVEVRFPELGDRVLLRCYVAWRRSARVREGTPAGVGVEIDGGERSKRDFLLQVARGEGARTFSRSHRRLPVSLPAKWHVVDARDHHEAVIADVSAGGAFLVTDAACPIGTQIVVELVPPGGAAPLDIEARVVWASSEPGRQGLGVEFRCRDTGGLRRLKEMVRRLEQHEATAA
jgi:Tfp pilus assembly protein PilZ